MGFVYACLFVLCRVCGPIIGLVVLFCGFTVVLVVLFCRLMVVLVVLDFVLVFLGLVPPFRV